MRQRIAIFLSATCLLGLLFAATASAEFGIRDADVSFTNKDGSPATQAGSHPFAMSTTIDFNTRTDPKLGVLPDGSTKDVVADLPPGFAADPNAVPQCSNADFLTQVGGLLEPNCPAATAIGTIQIREAGLFSGDSTPVYNLVPPPGIASKFAFRLLGVSAVIEGGIRSEGAQNLFATVSNISQAEPVTGSKVTLWGNPSDPAHDSERGRCLNEESACAPVELAKRAFITLPRSCTGPVTTLFKMDSWVNPGVWDEAATATHDSLTPPNPIGMTGCAKLGFGPTITAQPTTKAAESPTGLDFGLDVHDEGITSPSGLAQSDIRKVEVTLPKGFSTNPSIAEGLSACTEADLARETAFSAPGAGCPEASKIGTVEAETPLLDESLNGALYIAKPYENPFGSLLALYIVIKNANRGVMVKQAARVDPDPATGQLVTTTENMVQAPISHVRIHFREGTRSPLASPPAAAPTTPRRP